MIHRLIGRQPRDRGQHAIGIGGQHDDVGRNRAEIVDASVGNEVDRIGTAAVFRERIIIEIKGSGDGIDHHVFQDRSEALGGSEDFWLGLGREADHFGITATFEIEHRAIRPAMLVITDQRPACIG